MSVLANRLMLNLRQEAQKDISATQVVNDIDQTAHLDNLETMLFNTGQFSPNGVDHIDNDDITQLDTIATLSERDAV